MLEYFRVPLKSRVAKGRTRFDLDLPVYGMRDEGTRVLVVVDRVPTDDILDGVLFRQSLAGKALKNIMLYADEKANGKLAECAFINFHEFRVMDMEAAQRSACEADFTLRIEKFVKKFKPDVIIAMGSDVAKFMLNKDDLSGNFGRLVKYPKNRKIKFMYTMGVWDFCPDVPEEKKKEEGKKLQAQASLSGILARHFEYAIRNKNLFTLDKSDFKIEVVDTMKKFNRMMNAVAAAKHVAIDTETKSLARVANKILTIQFAVSGDKAWILPFEHASATWSKKDFRRIKTRLKNYFERGESEYHLFQNSKFDLTQLKVQLGLRFYAHEVYDVSGGEYALEENSKFLSDHNLKHLQTAGYKLDHICMRYGWNPYKGAGVDKNSRQNIATMKLEKFVRYAATDVIVLFRIRDVQFKRAKHEDWNLKTFKRAVTVVLSAMNHVFSEMEMTGHLTDRKHLVEALRPGGGLQLAINELQEKFKESKYARRTNKRLIRKRGAPKKTLFGGKPWEFDITKPATQQMLFFDVMGIEPLAYGKSGAAQVGKAFIATYGDPKKPLYVPEVEWFGQLKKSNTTKSSFLVPFWKRLMTEDDMKLDQRLRSSYNYLQIITGRSGCFDGDTPIYTLDPRGVVPIKEIKKGDWVWSYDDKLKPVAAQVSWAGVTKTTDDLVRVSYIGQGNRKYKSVVCTPDHRFRLRDGSYVEAKDLQRGDRVLAIERKSDIIKGYRNVYYTGQTEPNNSTPEHVLVSKPRKGLQVHHKDHVADNNVPSNLQNLTPRAHLELHGMSYLTYTKKSKAQKRIWAETPNRKSNYPVLYGRDNPSHYDIDPKWARKVLIEHGGKMTVFRDVFGMDYETVQKKFTEMDFWPVVEEIKLRSGSKGYITDAMIKKARRLTNYVWIGRELGISYYKAQRLLEGDNNHVIMEVKKFRGKARPVYDLTIPKYHNFIANGVCVHNSSDPNLQNIPARGPLAKLVKRIFIPGLGNIYIKVDFSAHEVRNWANVSGDDVLGGRFKEALKLKRKFILTDRESEKFEKVVELLKKRGDIHIQNVKLFYDQWVDKEHPLRQSIKVVIFGTIYGKGPFSLSVDLGKTEEEAQELIDKLFTMFPKGGDWLEGIKTEGQKNFIVESRFGFKRHLWGHLVPDRSVAGAMDRRGPNSLIQGPSSQMGFIAGRELQRLKWKYFYEKDLQLTASQNNAVHDSLENESSIGHLPINLYLTEHALTTQVARVCSEKFGWDLAVDLDCEFEIGGSLAAMHKWDQRWDTLPGIVDETAKYLKDELKRDTDKKELKKFEHNLGVISKLRLAEVKADLKADVYPSKRMNLNSKIVKELAV